MRSFLLIFSGISIGFWISWPGILIPNNWLCLHDIISNSTNEKISLKVVLALSPKFILKGQDNDIASKIRIISDACFR